MRRWILNSNGMILKQILLNNIKISVFSSEKTHSISLQSSKFHQSLGKHPLFTVAINSHSDLFYLLTVGVEGWCRTWSHSSQNTHTRTHTRTHTQLHTHSQAHTHTHTDTHKHTHTQTHTNTHTDTNTEKHKHTYTLGKSHLDEGSARRWDLYLTTKNIHKRQI
jgi:hypothetical protein